MELDGLWVLFCFLPLFLVVYYITPDEEKVLTLLAGSVVYLYFFAWDGTWRSWAVIGMIIAVYWAARLRWDTLGVMLCFGVWGVYAVDGTVPFWVRFLLLQATGSLVEVRRGGQIPGGVVYAASMLMFPKLSCGPYVPVQELSEQISAPRIGWQRSREGIQELIMGLGCAVILGGWSAGAAHMITVGTLAPGSWVRVILDAMSFYFRFLGVCAMAVGVGKLLGFDLVESFRRPWCAHSVMGFFSRWNVSLWKWLDLMLGISEKSGWCKAAALMVAGIIMGAWYGPRDQTLLWGIFIGIVMAAEQGSFSVWARLHAVLARIYTVVMVMIGWGIFFVDDPGQLMRSVGSTIGPSVWVVVLLDGFFCTSIPADFVARYRDKLWFDGALVLLFWCCVWFLV